MLLTRSEKYFSAASGDGEESFSFPGDSTSGFSLNSCRSRNFHYGSKMAAEKLSFFGHEAQLLGIEGEEQLASCPLLRGIFAKQPKPFPGMFWMLKGTRASTMYVLGHLPPFGHHHSSACGLQHAMQTESVG